jgi:hypothetical protein
MIDDIILDKEIAGGITLRSADAIQFLQWVIKKVNDSGLPPNKVAELTMLSTSYPGRYMADYDKMAIVNKMADVGISL